MNDEGQCPTEREKLDQIIFNYVHVRVEVATKVCLPGLKLILEQL